MKKFFLGLLCLVLVLGGAFAYINKDLIIEEYRAYKIQKNIEKNKVLTPMPTSFPIAFIGPTMTRPRKLRSMPWMKLG